MPSGYTYYKTLTISKTNVASDLPGQRVYWKMDADTDVGAVCLSNGHDVIFTDSTGATLLTFDRKQFAVSGGAATGHFWFVTEPTTAVDATVRVYYGNSGASDTSSATGTFPTTSPAYKAAMHCADGTTLSVADATGNLTPTNHGATAVSGVSGGLAQFNGSSDYIDGDSLTLGAAFTVKALVKVDSTISNPNGARIIETSYASGFFLGINAGNFWAIVNTPGATGVNAGAVGTNVLHRVALTVTGTTLALYVDGTSVGTTTITNPGSTTIGLTIGKYFGGAGYEFKGTMAEIHILDAAESADALKFDSANLLNSGNEITVGSQTSTGSPPVITSTLTASGRVGRTFAPYTVTATNTPTSYALSGGPAGLSIDTSTGVISGNPTTNSGSPYSATISATNADGTGSATLVITVADMPSGLIVRDTFSTGDFSLANEANGSGIAVQATYTWDAQAYAAYIPSGTYLRYSQTDYAVVPTASGTLVISGYAMIPTLPVSGTKNFATIKVNNGSNSFTDYNATVSSTGALAFMDGTVSGLITAGTWFYFELIAPVSADASLVHKCRVNDTQASIAGSPTSITGTLADDVWFGNDTLAAIYLADLWIRGGSAVTGSGTLLHVTGSTDNSYNDVATNYHNADVADGVYATGSFSMVFPVYLRVPLPSHPFTTVSQVFVRIYGYATGPNPISITEVLAFDAFPDSAGSQVATMGTLSLPFPTLSGQSVVTGSGAFNTMVPFETGGSAQSLRIALAASSSGATDFFIDYIEIHIVELDLTYDVADNFLIPAIKGNSGSVIDVLTASETQGTAITTDTMAALYLDDTSPDTWLNGEFSATGLPAGLTINSVTGDITGTPTVSGTVTAEITALNGVNTSYSRTRRLVFTIAAPSGGPFPHFIRRSRELTGGLIGMGM